MRMRATSCRILGAALVPLLLAAACAQPPDRGEAATVTSPPSASDPAAPRLPSPEADAVRQASPAVERFCRSKFPDHYAALAIGPDQKRLIVYRRPHATLDDAVRGQFPSLTIDFENARYSERELTAVVQRILADVDYWRGRGVDIQGVGPAGDGNSVLVTTQDPGPAQNLLTPHYGLAITVQPGGNVILIPPMDPSKLPKGTSR
jgi:hypothetical protein